MSEPGIVTGFTASKNEENDDMLVKLLNVSTYDRSKGDVAKDMLGCVTNF